MGVSGKRQENENKGMKKDWKSILQFYIVYTIIAIGK